MNSEVQNALASLAPDARVLDCGGWFIPLPQATHVVDLMPYETRGARLQLTPLPGERFTRDTWTQLDFLAADFRLPFADRTFDFAYCSHTIEDLKSPFALLGELARVSRAGALVTPSRLSEQTAGRRDRMTNRQGHPHHHWIVDTYAGRPRFASKTTSFDGAWWSTSIPLQMAEKIHRANPESAEWAMCWKDTLSWEIVSPTEARELARTFASASGANLANRAVDRVYRSLRKLKYLGKPDNESATRNGWADIVALSQPYSRIPLK